MADLIDERLAICKECPLYKDSSMGAICNPNKYMNEEGKISFFPRDGYKPGCNCILKRKAGNPDSHCKFGKW